MRDKEFDQFLRKKLAEFQTVESKDPTWTRLEESLKEDKKFDNSIRHKLRGIHPVRSLLPGSILRTKDVLLIDAKCRSSMLAQLNPSYC